MNESDGVVNGQPFFSAARSGNVRVQAPSVIGPAASTILGLGVKHATSTDGADALTKIANNFREQISAEGIQQQRQQNMLKGMQAVAMGKTLDDVTKEQPWYTKIFGKSDVVLGAEMYAQQTLADSVVHDIRDNMKIIREMEPDQARQIIGDRFKAASTGIPSVDIQVQGHLLKAFPSIMDAYTKESLKWRQEQADKAQRASFDSSFAIMSKELKDLSIDPTSPSGRAEAAISVAEFDLRYDRPVGQTDEAWRANVYGSIKSQLLRIGTPMVTTGPDGQPVTTYVDAHGAQGLLMSRTFSKLTPEQQTELSHLAETQMTKAGNKFMAGRVDEIARLKAWISDPPPGMTVKDVQSLMEKVNSDVARDSGSIVPVFDAKDLADNSARFAAGVAARKEREETKRLRDLMSSQGSESAVWRQAMAEDIQNYILRDPARAFAARDAGFLPSKEFNTQLNALYAAASPEDKLKLMRASPSGVPAAKAERVLAFDTTFNLDQQEFIKQPSLVLNLLKRYADDKEAGLGELKLSANYTPERRKILEDGLVQLATNTPPDVIAASMWNATRSVPTPRARGEDYEEADRSLDDRASWGWFTRWWNPSKGRAPLAGVTLPEEIREDFKSDLAHEIARHRENGTNDLKGASQAAIKDMLDPVEGMYEMVGGWPVKKLYRGQKGLGQTLADGAGGKYKPIPAEDQQEFMQWVMKRKLKERSGDLDSIRPAFTTAGGEVLFHFRASDASDSFNIPITQKELTDLYWDTFKHSGKEVNWTPLWGKSTDSPLL